MLSQLANGEVAQVPCDDHRRASFHRCRDDMLIIGIGQFDGRLLVCATRHPHRTMRRDFGRHDRDARSAHPARCSASNTFHGVAVLSAPPAAGSGWHRGLAPLAASPHARSIVGSTPLREAPTDASQLCSARLFRAM